MRKSRLMALTLSVAMTAGMLATGCQSGNEKLEADGSSSDGEKTKIVFLRGGTEPEITAYWEEQIKGFEEKYPNIEVEYQTAPYGDDMETKLNTGFASGTAPDIINHTMASMGSRVPMGQYECLDEYVNNWSDKDDILDRALELGSVNDQVYGIGVQADPKMLMWNKELFEEAGLDPETPPTNWEELLEFHKKLTVKNDKGEVTQVGFGLPTTGQFLNHYLSIFIEQNGVKNLVDENTNEVLLNTPESVEAATFLKEIVDAGNIPWDSTQNDQNPFLTGLSAMTIGNENDFKTFNQGELEGKIGIAEPLQNTQQATFCGMNFLFMSSESQHKEEAWKFIEYMSSKDAMWSRFEQLGCAPLRESLKDAYLEAAPETGNAVLESIESGTGSPKVPYANSVYNFAAEAMEKIYFDVASPQDALNEAADKIQDEIDNQ